MTVDLLKDDKCLACGKCIYSCPTNAIVFQEGVSGNIEPAINKDKCIECGKCVDACKRSFQKDSYSQSRHYIGCSTDESVRKEGASGGIFFEIAREIINQGGIVFGATFDADKRGIIFLKCEKIDDVCKLRKSKYAQSDWTNCIKEIDDTVTAGKNVLLSGLPCQIDAMIDRYGTYNKITFVDLYCHGVIGSKYFREYIDSFEKRIEAVEFRGEQEDGKNNFTLKLFSEKGELVLCENCEQNTFYQCFVYGAILKDACYECPYSQYRHKADITLGDFSFPEIALKMGYTLPNLSFIGVNSKKGNKIIERIKRRIKLTLMNEESVVNTYYPNHREHSGLWGYNPTMKDRFCETLNKYGDVRIALSSVFKKETDLVIESIEKFSGKTVYLYGAGEVGRRMAGIIHMLFPKTNIKAFIVTKKMEGVNSIDGIKIMQVDELLLNNDNPQIIVSVKEQYREEVLGILNEKGINNYVG